MNLVIVIMAAGKGTRMRSQLPKVLHRLAGRPMIDYSVELASRLSPEPPVIVVGHGAGQVRAAVGDRARFVVQEQQLGTGHAVLQTASLLESEADLVLVYAADMPLLTPESLRRLVATHGQHAGPLTMLTVIADDPRGFGRVVRGQAGEVLGVVEEVEATPEQRAIRELNVGVYCFDASWLWPALRRLQPSPKKGEYYITDTIGLAVADGYHVVAVVTEDRRETLGVNTRVHLSEAEQVLRERKNHELMLSGVTMIDPASTYVEPQVEVGNDSTLWPGVHLRGGTMVGEGCEIGPGAVLTNAVIGARCQVGALAILEDVVIPAGSVIGPGARMGQE